MTKFGTVVTGEGDGSRSAAASSAAFCARSSARWARSSAARWRRSSARWRRSAAARRWAAARRRSSAREGPWLRLAGASAWAAGAAAGFGCGLGLRLGAGFGAGAGAGSGAGSSAALASPPAAASLGSARGQVPDRPAACPFSSPPRRAIAEPPAPKTRARTSAARAGNRRVMSFMAWTRVGTRRGPLSPIGAPGFRAETALRRLGHPSRAQEAGNSRQDPCTGAAPPKVVRLGKTPSAKTHVVSRSTRRSTPPPPSTAIDPMIVARALDPHDDAGRALQVRRVDEPVVGEAAAELRAFHSPTMSMPGRSRRSSRSRRPCTLQLPFSMKTSSPVERRRAAGRVVGAERLRLGAEPRRGSPAGTVVVPAYPGRRGVRRDCGRLGSVVEAAGWRGIRDSGPRPAPAARRRPSCPP